MVEVFHFRVLYSCIYDYPPTCEELFRKKSEHNNFKCGPKRFNEIAPEKVTLVQKIVPLDPNPVSLQHNRFCQRLRNKVKCKARDFPAPGATKWVEAAKLKTGMQAPRTSFVINATQEENVSLFLPLSPKGNSS